LSPKRKISVCSCGSSCSAARISRLDVDIAAITLGFPVRRNGTPSKRQFVRFVQRYVRKQVGRKKRPFWPWAAMIELQVIRAPSFVLTGFPPAFFHEADSRHLLSLSGITFHQL